MNLTIKENQDIEYCGFVLHKNGMSPVGSPTFEQWEEIGRFIKKSSRSVQFWLGDWINYGENVFGEKYSQALEETDYTLGTLQNTAWVSSKIDPSRRRDNLSFGHHQNVAHLGEGEQERWLTIAEEEMLTVREMRDRIRGVTKLNKHTCPKCGYEWEDIR